MLGVNKIRSNPSAVRERIESHLDTVFVCRRHVRGCNICLTINIYGGCIVREWAHQTRMIAHAVLSNKIDSRLVHVM
jgi:hypothetical protein